MHPADSIKISVEDSMNRKSWQKINAVSLLKISVQAGNLSQKSTTLIESHKYFGPEKGDQKIFKFYFFSMFVKLTNYGAKFKENS